MTFYQNGAVSVDRDFARFGSKSYAIRQINSVDVRTTPPRRSNWPTWLLAAIVFAGPGYAYHQPAALIAGAVLALLAARSYRKTHRSLHRLMLHTSSREVQAYETRDDDDIIQLRDAIEAAMAGR